MVCRGLETLKVRLKAQAKTALKVAQFLESRDEIGTVIYPALDNFDQKERFDYYFKGANGLVTFSLKPDYSYAKQRELVNALQSFGIGYSWAGSENLVMLYDGKFTRPKQYDPNQNFIRLSIGSQSAKDSIADIDNALKAL